MRSAWQGGRPARGEKYLFLQRLAPCHACLIVYNEPPSEQGKCKMSFALP